MGWSQHLLNRGQTELSYSGGQVRLNLSQHLLNRGQTREPVNGWTGIHLQVSQHLLNRGQTLETVETFQRPDGSQHLLNRGQTNEASQVVLGMLKVTNLLNRGQTWGSPSRPRLRWQRSHNTFLIEVKHCFLRGLQGALPWSQHLLNRGQTLPL